MSHVILSAPSTKFICGIDYRGRKPREECGAEFDTLMELATHINEKHKQLRKKRALRANSLPSEADKP